jgi:hypothetical protein
MKIKEEKKTNIYKDNDDGWVGGKMNGSIVSRE